MTIRKQPLKSGEGTKVICMELNAKALIKMAEDFYDRRAENLAVL